MGSISFSRDFGAGCLIDIAGNEDHMFGYNLGFVHGARFDSEVHAVSRWEGHKKHVGKLSADAVGAVNKYMDIDKTI